MSSIARPSMRPFQSDFFSPLPHKWKGKEKAVDSECGQCWSDIPSCFSRHSLRCPIRGRLFNERIPCRSQPFFRPPQRCTRRHASSAARTLSSQTRLPDSDPPSLEPQDPVDAFRSLLTARSPFDPEHAWRLYTSIQVDTRTPMLPAEQLLFIQRLLDAFDLSGDVPPDLPLLYTWAIRLEPVLRDLISNSEVTSSEIVSLECFSAQILAWLGDVAQASQSVRELSVAQPNRADKHTLLRVYRNILVLLRYQQDASCVLDLLIREWDFLGPFYRSRAAPDSQAASFRNVIHTLLADIPDGANLLCLRSKTNQDVRSRMGELLLEAYLANKLLHQTHALVLELDRQQLPVKFGLRTKLVRFLAQRDLFALAHQIFTSADSSTDPRLYHSTGLYLYARRGDVDRAERFYSKHIDNDWSLPVARCMLMHAYAVVGKAKKVVELFRQFFPATSGNNFLGERPGIIHYTTVILAHAQLADLDGIDLWLEKMIEAGCRPDGHVYSIVLQSFAKHRDVDSVAAIFDQMRSAGVKPDRFHYTSVITLLARRKDAVAAEAFYLQALREGITPDRMMITSLMNAHVEAGSWEGVVRVFDYLRQSSHFRRDLSIEVYNTLLKAYVLIGAPFRVVFTVFRKLVRVGVRPDGYTYALVIQSACDAGKMDVAKELFAEMEDKDLSEPLQHFDTYILSIIIAGHVRQGSKARAMACYESMQRRGIKPNSVTYKQILCAYANDGTEESLKIAESFLKQVMDADTNDNSWTGLESRPSALGNIHGPLMLAYARKERPEQVARLFNGMLEAGGEPSLQSLTVLLDVHRRTDNIDAVRQLWPQIWTLALRLSYAEELFRGSTTTPVPKRHSNLLCMPLSIYIDALSVAGDHRAVLDAWTKAKAEGFYFDAHNWNHLAVVLVRAGELDRAFEVLERVLIPYSRKGPVIRDPFPESPLVFDTMDPESEMPASDAPMRREGRRAEAVKIATWKAETLLATSQESTDFAHPLHILHQVIPGLSMWRPHVVTLQVLSSVLRHLRRGLLVQPIYGPGAPPATHEHADAQSQLDIASVTLKRIYRSYPEAVRAVVLYERGQARREAAQRSPKQWIKAKQQVVDTLGGGDAIGFHG